MTFDIPLTNASEVATFIPTGVLFANSLPSETTISPTWTDPLPLPNATGFASLRISVNYLAPNGGA